MPEYTIPSGSRIWLNPIDEDSEFSLALKSLIQENNKNFIAVYLCNFRRSFFTIPKLFIVFSFLTEEDERAATWACEKIVRDFIDKTKRNAVFIYSSIENKSDVEFLSLLEEKIRPLYFKEEVE